MIALLIYTTKEIDILYIIHKPFIIQMRNDYHNLFFNIS